MFLFKQAGNSIKQLKFTLLHAPKLQQGFQFSSSSSQVSSANPTENELVKNIISSHIAYKEALLSLINTYIFLQNVESSSPLRTIKKLHSEHIESLNKIGPTYRVTPPMTPITNAGFSLLGSIHAIAAQSEQHIELAGELSRIVENHTDFCLFHLNQSKTEVPELRKLIIQMRDSSWEISSKFIDNTNQEEIEGDAVENEAATTKTLNSEKANSNRQCVKNISEYIFTPILRRHFKGEIPTQESN